MALKLRQGIALVAVGILGFISFHAHSMSCAKLVSSGQQSLSEMMNSPLDPFDIGIKPIPSGVEGLAVKVAMANRARVSIDASFYIFADDKSGQALLHAYSEAVKRGVKVRLIVDGTNVSSYNSWYLEALTSLNDNPLYSGSVEVIHINPLISIKNTFRKLSAFVRTGTWLFNPLAMNNRSHDKIQIIDAGTEESFATLGGRNVENIYFGVDGKEYEDYEVLIRSNASLKGASLAETLTRHFKAMFDHELNLATRHSAWFLWQYIYEGHLGQFQSSYSDLMNSSNFKSTFDDMESDKFWNEGFEESKAVFMNERRNLTTRFRDRVFNSKFRDENREVTLSSSFFKVLERSTGKVDFVTPYVLFSRLDLDKIKGWLLSDPENVFNVYTNSYWTTSSITVYALFRYTSMPLIQKLKNDPDIGDRIKVHFYMGDIDTGGEARLLHMKAIQMNNFHLVTTANFDPRSRLHNSEIGIWTSSELSRGAIEEKVEDIRTHSLESEEYLERTRGARVYESILYYYSQFISSLGISSLF